MEYQLDYINHNELKGLIEDSVEHFCNEHMISGELAWTVASCLAQAKIEMFKGRL